MDARISVSTSVRTMRKSSGQIHCRDGGRSLHSFLATAGDWPQGIGLFSLGLGSVTSPIFHMSVELYHQEKALHGDSFHVMQSSTSQR